MILTTAAASISGRDNDDDSYDGMPAMITYGSGTDDPESEADVYWAAYVALEESEHVCVELLVERYRPNLVGGSPSLLKLHLHSHS